MKKNLFTISLVLILCITNTYNVLAEENLEPGKCSITIDKSKNTFSNRSQATGPCKGLVEGYYLDGPILYGSYTGPVSNGQEVLIGTPKVPYGESNLTVKVIEGTPPKENNEDKKPVDPAPDDEQKTQDKDDSNSNEKNKNSNTESNVKEKNSNNGSKSSTNTNSSSPKDKNNVSHNNKDTTVKNKDTDSINTNEKKENKETTTAASKQVKDSSNDTNESVEKSKESDSNNEEKIKKEKTEEKQIKTAGSIHSSTEGKEISNTEVNESESSPNLWIWIVIGLTVSITVILTSILIYKKRKGE
ncbi:hypothetical protein [Oceanobacillus kimchii]|uniref:Uncharacterized protein n=1 Tax=Oceanobacillus kimchii TaxID=746691 RepID=A0ABQ5TPY8_9BACI|nr:hypothetical protein [Oceanobacillus kimchii]GLO68267.1 hypothetical protein MACH08_40510 [Oceanobacillus kimchii]